MMIEFTERNNYDLVFKDMDPELQEVAETFFSADLVDVSISVNN